MKYQLVVQFSESVDQDYDWLIDVEDKLYERLPGAEVDGHDIGIWEMNIFILTNSPAETFDLVKKILIQSGISVDGMKSAYRNFSEEEYFCLWPKDLKTFDIK